MPDVITNEELKIHPLNISERVMKIIYLLKTEC